MMKKPDLLHVDTNSLKLKVEWKKIGLGMVINGCAHSGGRARKLDSISQRNYSNKLVWGVLVQIVESLKLL